MPNLRMRNCLIDIKGRQPAMKNNDGAHEYNCSYDGDDNDDDDDDDDDDDYDGDDNDDVNDDMVMVVAETQ